MALVYPDIILSGNPNAYGIVQETHVTGARTVQTLAELYAISDAILSPSGNNTNNDALGQIWYVSNDTTNNGSYRLKDWTNRKSAGGWDKLIVTGGELGQSGVTSVNNLTGDISIVGDGDTIEISRPSDSNDIKISTTNVVRTDGTTGVLNIKLQDGESFSPKWANLKAENNNGFSFTIQSGEAGTGEFSINATKMVLKQNNAKYDNDLRGLIYRTLEFPNYDENNNNLDIKLECDSNYNYQGLYFSTGEVTLLASNYDHNDTSDLTKAASIQLWNNNSNHAPKITFGIPTNPSDENNKLFTYEFDTNIGDTSQQNKTIATVDYVDSKVGDVQSDRIKSANEYAVAVATESGTNGTLTLAASGEGGEINLDSENITLGTEDNKIEIGSNSQYGVNIQTVTEDIYINSAGGNISIHSSGELAIEAAGGTAENGIDIRYNKSVSGNPLAGLKIHGVESDVHIDFYDGDSINVAVPLTKSGTLALVEDIDGTYGKLDADNTWVGGNTFNGSIKISQSGEEIFNVSNATVSVGDIVNSFTWKGKTIATTDQIKTYTGTAPVVVSPDNKISINTASTITNDSTTVPTTAAVNTAIEALKTQVAGGIIYKGKIGAWRVSGEDIVIQSGKGLPSSETFKNGYMVMLNQSGEVNGAAYDAGDYVIYSGTEEIPYTSGKGWIVPIADCSFINSQDSNVAKTDEDNMWVGDNTFYGSTTIAGTGENLFVVSGDYNYSEAGNGEPIFSIFGSHGNMSLISAVGSSFTWNGKQIATTDQIKTITLPEGTKQLPTDGSYTINDVVVLLNKIAAALGAPVHS